MVKAYVRDGIYIPIKYVKEEHKDQVVARFEKQVFHKEQVCEKCDYYSERVCDVCESCANYGGTLKLHRKVLINDKSYLKLPFGDVKGVQKIFGRVEFIQKLEPIPMKRRIKFTANLKVYQVPACKALENTQGGILKSAPRTGKTVMSAKSICKLGLKTIILASQRDWLENFYETFVGSETQAAMTNASKKRIGFAKKLADFEKYDVCLVTYQTFLSEGGKKLLNKVKKMFSVMVVDEVQTVPAIEFSIVVATFQCLYKHGLSGTPERKDCVGAGTQVLTEEGLKSIEDIQVGDQVVTTQGLKPVVETHIRENSKLLRLEFDGGTLVCTPDHQLWSVTRQAWVAASDLQPGEELREFTSNQVDN